MQYIVVEGLTAPKAKKTDRERKDKAALSNKI